MIKKRVEISAKPLTGLSDKPAAVAAEALFEQLSGIYVVTDQLFELFEHFIGVSRRHCDIVYTDGGRFISDLYRADVGIQKTMMLPIVMTGDAGGGKSEFSKALKRLYPSNSFHEVDDIHSSFALEALWNTSVENGMSVRDIVASFVPGEANGKLKSLIATLRRRAFMIGVSLATIDESQFIALSKEASSTAVKLLYAVMALFVPLLYVANFSHYRQLQSRPPQDRQRLLLARTIVFRLEASGSPGWLAMLAEFRKVTPELAMLIDLQAVVHAYTAGVPRLVVRLLSGAYLACRARMSSLIEAADLLSAYLSTTYAADREDVEEMLAQKIRRDPGKRLDLWCPIDCQLPITTAAPPLSSASTEQKVPVVPVSRIESQLTKAEKKTLHDVRVAAAKAKVEARKGGSTPLAKAEKSPEAVLQNTEAYARSLLRGAKRA